MIYLNRFNNSGFTDLVSNYNSAPKKNDGNGWQLYISKIFFQVCETSLLKQQQDNIEFELKNINQNTKVTKLGKLSKNYQAFRTFFDSSDVIVSTPALLLQSLILGHLNISEIDMIIFDECHHCDKEHPYAMIMKEFY